VYLLAKYAHGADIVFCSVSWCVQDGDAVEKIDAVVFIFGTAHSNLMATAHFVWHSHVCLHRLVSALTATTQREEDRGSWSGEERFTVEEDSEVIHTVRLESCHDSRGSIFNGLRWVELRGEGGGDEGQRGGREGRESEIGVV